VQRLSLGVGHLLKRREVTPPLLKLSLRQSGG
jgi:hypothetical protein